MHTSTDSKRGIGQKNAAFWTNVATHYTRHKPEGGADRHVRSLETKWSDIKQFVAKFSGFYLSVKNLNESGKNEDDIVLDAMNLYKQKYRKTFVLKHCWLLLKSYPRFSAIFMGKRKAGGFDPPSRDALLVDRRDLLSLNGEAPSTDSPPAHIRPQAAKSSKNEHAHSKGKEQVLRANAKDTTDFAAATLKKAEQIAQQNTFSLFTLEDKNITCDLARQWLHLRRTQELAKLKAHVAASNVPFLPRVGVCSSPSNISLAPAPTQHQGLGFRNAPAPTHTIYQGSRFRDLNEDDDADDCAELDCEDDSSDLFGDMKRIADLNAFGNDFCQSASDREEDSTIIIDSQTYNFEINPPPSQRRRLSHDPHDMHANHVLFWTSEIREEFTNRHVSSQQTHTPLLTIRTHLNPHGCRV